MDKIKLLKNMCGENPGNVELFYLLGIEYRNAGMAKESILAFSDALKNARGEMFDRIMKEIGEIGSKESSEKVIDVGGELPGSATVVPLKKYETDASGMADGNDEAEEEDRNEEAEENETASEAGTPVENTDDIARFRVIRGSKAMPESHLRQDGPPAVRFEDVGGLEDLKNTIRMKIIKPFLTPGLFERFKKKSGGGLLLFGPPGCGKTFIARATAGECSAFFKPVHITDVLDSYFGQSAQNVKDIFSVARAQKPCILFFDEIDTIGFNRAKTSTDMMRSVVDQLLSEIEGIDTNTDRILIIGATNMPWDVDPALRRPGRFDRTIFVPPPDLAARETIFQLKLQGKPCERIDCSSLARESELFSGADIENVIDTATENVLDEILSSGDERKLRQSDLMNALKGVKPTTIEWLRTIANYVKYANQSGVYDDVERYLSRHRKFF